MTTPYENGYQLGVQHREPVGGDLSASREQEYEKARERLSYAYESNDGPGGLFDPALEQELQEFDDGYLRGRYGMGARKVGGGSTPW